MTNLFTLSYVYGGRGEWIRYCFTLVVPAKGNSTYLLFTYSFIYLPNICQMNICWWLPWFFVHICEVCKKVNQGNSSHLVNQNSFQIISTNLPLLAKGFYCEHLIFYGNTVSFLQELKGVIYFFLTYDRNSHQYA